MFNLIVLVPDYIQKQFGVPEFISLKDALILVGKKTDNGYICIDRVRNTNHDFYGELRLNCK